ncbi:hypothetical protein ACI797_17500 [Geodermatophilus sp. SYSU D00691]
MIARPLLLAAAATLALSACTTSSVGSPDRLGTPASVGIEAPYLLTPADVVPTADGDVLVRSLGEAGVADWLTLVDGASGDVGPRSEAQVLDLAVDAARVDGDVVLLAGRGHTDPSAPWVFGVWVVAPATGALLEHRPVDAVPPDQGGTVAAFAPDGTLVVLWTAGSPAPPVLHTVDPATGALLGSAVLELDGLPGRAGHVEPERLVVSPDGRHLVAAVHLYGLDGAEETVTVLVRVDRGTGAVEPPVPLGDGTSHTGLHGLAVGDDGTVHAGLAPSGAPDRLAVLGPGDDRLRDLGGTGELPVAIAVDDRGVWVLGPGTTLSRVDPADGSVTATAELCGAGVRSSEALALAPDGTVHALGVCAGGVVLWTVAGDRSD